MLSRKAGKTALALGLVVALLPMAMLFRASDKKSSFSWSISHHRRLKGKTSHIILNHDPKTVQLRDVVATPRRHVDPMPTGSWILDKDKSFAFPFCCDRRWKSKVGICSASGAGCICHDFHDQYTWSESSPWDPSDVCRRLNGRRVVMVGDSTMNQAADVLMNAVVPGGCHKQFKYAISDTLIDRELGRFNRGGSWLRGVLAYDPHIVIVTAGAHIFGRENFDLVLGTFIEEAKELMRTKPSIQVVWKTQQPGGCTHDIIANNEVFPRETNKYNYDEFYERDQYVLSILPTQGIHVIDMRMLYYRSDGHIDSRVDNPDEQKDCLHMCAPGPLDVVADLFSKLLDRLGEVGDLDMREGAVV